ncbi:hypothetical protein E6C70_12790 [Glaciibacter flavus]|uniref:Copper resistance protein D domain-containing protein n=1 Tax=Orlajensenia flava TaxID=2565934 RepID=A0A4S4FSW8_9MICO|nr:cytochrome c oxidase assembly protein [Glaciibacter flavus]THG32616.1 hypothetical protein E6C70_12790 [Glaciibacter flavus]
MSDTPTTEAAPESPAEDVNREQIRLPHVDVTTLVLALCVPLTVAMTLLAMVFTGAFTTGRALFDPGDLVTYGLPIARAVHDLAAAATIGLLLLAVFIAPGQTKDLGALGRSQWRSVRWAAWAAAVWLASASTVVVLTGVEISGVGPGQPGFIDTMKIFLFSVELGQSLLFSTLCVLIVLVVAAFARRLTPVAFAFGIGLFALLPLALSGHAAGSFEHANAVNSLALHLVGVTLWVGGLLALILLRGTIGRGFGTSVARYSTLAGWAFAAVAASGIVNSSLRLSTPADLFQPYGVLIIAKSTILVVLGLAGFMQRRRIIPALLKAPTERRLFIRFAVAEVVFMAVAIGISVGLSKSAPPVSQEPLSGDLRREGLLGFPYPPAVDFARMFTEFHWDWSWVMVAASLAGLYSWAYARMRQRGDRWPVYRLVAWLLGCLALVWVTSGGAAVYGEIHFSTHMVQHMALMMVVPPLLVLGGPVLLALRVLPTRHDGSRGIREWLLLFTHSRFLRLLSRPAVAGVIFAGSLIVFYYSPAFQSALFSHPWHIFMIVHFLLSGYLFTWVFIGIDPGPTRPPYPILLIVLLATMAFHAFFGVALMESSDILALDWWHALGQSDDTVLLADQHIGGGIVWGASELPMVLIALGVVYQWIRSDERTAKRLDRQADRDGDADLNAYNDRLQRMERTDNQSPARTPNT